MFDKGGRDFDVVVGEDDALVILGHIGTYCFNVSLAQGIGRTRADIGIEGAPLKQMACEIAGSSRAADIECSDAAEEPT